MSEQMESIIATRRTRTHSDLPLLLMSLFSIGSVALSGGSWLLFGVEWKWKAKGRRRVAALGRVSNSIMSLCSRGIVFGSPLPVNQLSTARRR